MFTEMPLSAKAFALALLIYYSWFSSQLMAYSRLQSPSRADTAVFKCKLKSHPFRSVLLSNLLVTVVIRYCTLPYIVISIH